LTPKLYGWRLNKSMRYTWIHAINEPRNFSYKPMLFMPLLNSKAGEFIGVVSELLGIK
jgi:hypothetical protein